MASRLLKTATRKDTDTLLSDIDTVVAGINERIQENNDIVTTKPDKQLACFNMVWEEIAFILTHNAFFHREITYNQVSHYRS